MRVFVKTKILNISPKFKKAIFKKVEVNRVYNSVKEARKFHNLINCNYSIINDHDVEIRVHNNAKIDGYGRRYI